jgi:outer membrane protein OmpA-like peptidoglycan-associated protein
MAELDVRPKRSNPWWLWLLLALVLLALLFFLLKGCNNKDGGAAATDSTSTAATDTSGAKQTIAATEPDWSSVNFNAPKSSDQDITDAAIGVSGTDKYTIYTLGENILFATDKSALQGSADAKLKQVVSSINKRFKGATVGVYGSTDDQGAAGANKQLGAERAAAVKDWLVKTGGLDSTKISVRSFGESKPVASNNTAAGRQQNRNVTIVAFPNGQANQ